MITMLLSKFSSLDAFIQSVGGKADVMNQLIIFFGIQLAVDNGLKIFETIQKEPIGLAVYLMLLWYGGIICLVCYYFTLERTSSNARRLHGVATLSSFAYILWTILSLVPSDFQVCFLSVCVTFCLFGVFFSSGRSFQLSTLRFLRSYQKILCALCQLIILGFELYKILSGPFHRAYSLKFFCHGIIAVLYGHYSKAQQFYGVAALSLIGYYWITLFVLSVSRQLSLLLGIIGSLDVMVCSVGGFTKSMLDSLKLAGVSLASDLTKLYEKLQERGNLIDYLKVICYGGVVLYFCYLGMLEDHTVNHRLAGAAFLFALGHFVWKISAQRALWFRVCCVCIADIVIVHLATSMDGSGKSTIPTA